MELEDIQLLATVQTQAQKNKIKRSKNPFLKVLEGLALELLLTNNVTLNKTFL